MSAFAPAPGRRGRQVLLRALALAMTVLLAGCGSLIPGGGPPPQLYRLTPKSTFPDQLPTVHSQLVIDEPLASGGLDTTRIALRPNQTEMQYYAGARWTARAPSMIQTLLVESFENSGHIVAVGRQVIGLRSDYNLLTELREFQADYYRGGATPDVWVRINAKIVRQPRQNIIASKSFERTVQAKGTDLPSVIEAFDESLGKVLKRIVDWSLDTIAADEKKGQ